MKFLRNSYTVLLGLLTIIYLGTSGDLVGAAEGFTTMSAPLIIKPNFNRIQNQASFPTNSINVFMQEELRDNFSIYQQKFGIFNWMRLNKMQKYVIHSMSGTPLLWQEHNSCGWDPVGSLFMNRRELEPCKAKINMEQCYDELFNSCFEHLLSWNGNGTITFDADATRIWNEITRKLAQGATLGAVHTLTVGQSYNYKNIEFNSKTPDSIKEMFTKTAGTCKGWLELLKAMAASNSIYKHMNHEGILIPEDFDGKNYTESVVDVYDELKRRGPNELQCLVDEGSVNSFDEVGTSAVLLVSNSLYRAVVQEFNEMCLSNTCLNPRLTREACPTGGGRNIYIFSIDGVPVIPINAPMMYEKYFTGSSHFAVLTATGNISLGGSFANLPEVNGNPANIGMIIEQGKNVQDMGKYYFLAHQLFSVSIADSNYVSATQVYAVPNK